MDLLKKVFPFSFGMKELAMLIIVVLVHVVVAVVAGFVLGLIPIVGGLLGTLVGLYCTAGWVLAVLDYLKILK